MSSDHVDNDNMQDIGQPMMLKIIVIQCITFQGCSSTKIISAHNISQIFRPYRSEFIW